MSTRSGDARRSEPPLQLAELIELELQLQRDAEQSIEMLDARDRVIAEHLAAQSVEGLAALRIWLDGVRGTRASSGTRLSELRDLTSVALFVIGTFMGITAVGGWLLHGTGSPVNVVHFWPAIIGVQLLFLGVWALRVIPSRWLAWLPGARTLHKLLTELVGLTPWVMARLLTRSFGSERDSALRALAELRRIDWLYARLRLWVIAGLSQAFAIGFNLGALGAFVAIPFIDDPAFGWRSRLLSADELQRTAVVVAAPWRSFAPHAVPTRDEVVATSYSSIDPRFGAVDRDVTELPVPWAAWWPFLVASLICYGLLPRCLLWITATLGVQSQLRRAPRRHAAYARLLERLARLSLDTRALHPELDVGQMAHDTQRAPGWSRLPSGSAYVLCWTGVPVSDAALSAELATAGVQARQLVRVGQVDAGADQRAIAEVALDKYSALTACLIVEIWEPPIGDYLDFMRALRHALGDERAIWVMLYEVEASADSRSDVQAEQWRKQLGALADPWLEVARWPTRRA